jgi:hypothetical protein
MPSNSLFFAAKSQRDASDLAEREGKKKDGAKKHKKSKHH